MNVSPAAMLTQSVYAGIWTCKMQSLRLPKTSAYHKVSLQLIQQMRSMLPIVHKIVVHLTRHRRSARNILQPAKRIFVG